MSNEGQISEDGMWRWDGQRWVPNTPGPPQAPPPPPRKRHTGRNIGIGCGGAIAAVVALIVILVAVNSGGSGSRTNTSSSPGQSSSQQGQASCKQPCAQSGGVTLAVTNVNPDAPPGQFSQVQPGNTLVTVTTEVTNQSSGTPPLVNPYDFKLQDAQGTQHTFAADQVAGCSSSSVNVAKGGTSGPQCFVYQVPQGKTTGLTLLWQNSSNPFGGAMQVKVN